MPKDNHSLLQLYLDGPKNNFFTFFDVFNQKSEKICKSSLLKSHSYLKNKSVNEIMFAQRLATANIFKKKSGIILIDSEGQKFICDKKWVYYSI